MAEDGGSEIIIKGGSCEIHFDENLIQKDPTDRKKRKHKCDRLWIKRIVIKTGKQSFDSGDIAGGFQGTIKISCSKKP